MNERNHSILLIISMIGLSMFMFSLFYWYTTSNYCEGCEVTAVFAILIITVCVSFVLGWVLEKIPIDKKYKGL